MKNKKLRVKYHRNTDNRYTASNLLAQAKIVMYDVDTEVTTENILSTRLNINGLAESCRNWDEVKDYLKDVPELKKLALEKEEPLTWLWIKMAYEMSEVSPKKYDAAFIILARYFVAIDELITIHGQRSEEDPNYLGQRAEQK